MKRRIKVLWIIKGLGPGGAERLLVSVARVGDHSRFEYHAAYVLRHKSELARSLEMNGVETHCLSGGGGTLGWPVALRRLLVRERYDVVHLHSPLVAGIARPVLFTLGRSGRPAVVSTEHNTWDSYSLPTRLLNAALYATDQRRWAVSTGVRDSIPAPLRRSVHVLVHGIVSRDFCDSPARQTIREDIGIGADQIVGITVANFRREKGYPDLLHAVAAAGRAVPSLCMLVVGQGPLERDIRQLHAELRLGDRCRILGYRSDVPALLTACDFFAMSSHFEGFPIALMEAMAAGLPVVATQVGGIPDAVAHGREGLLTPPGRPEALASAIVQMATDAAARARMSEHARRRGRTFDIRAAARVYEAAYQDIASRRDLTISPGE